MADIDHRTQFEAWARGNTYPYRLERSSDGINYQDGLTTIAFSVWQAAIGAQPAAHLLAAEHKGMRLDYSYFLRYVRSALRDQPVMAEVIRQLQGHLTELGQRWYAGDRLVVDELLQLYCIETDARRALIDSKAVRNG